MEPKTSLLIRYKNVDGWHVFSSEELPGLYVASQNARQAFDDVPNAIAKLLELNDGIKCMVNAEMSFEDFI